MSAQEHDRRIDGAIEELKALILQHNPNARFRIGTNPDEAAIVELVVTVDDDDPNRLLDVVVDRQMELQVAGLPVFVVTEPTPERAIAWLKAHRVGQAIEA